MIGWKSHAFRTPLLLFLALTFYVPTLGQEKLARKDQGSYLRNNYLGLQGGTFYAVNKINSFAAFGTVGISYNRRIYRKWHVEAAYMMWLVDDWDLFAGAAHQVLKNADGTSFKIGDLAVSENFKMVDITPMYNFLRPGGKHMLMAGLGITLYWGYNYYITGLSYYHPTSYVTGPRMREAFLGVNPQLSYRYNFLKGRCSAGFTIERRHLFDEKMFNEVDYIIGLGYNF